LQADNRFRRMDHVAAHAVGGDAVEDEKNQGHGHEHGAENRQLQDRRAGLRGDEQWQKGEKKDRQLGVEDVDQKALAGDFHETAPDRVVFEFEGAGFAPHGPGEIEQVADPGELDDLEGEGAHVQDGGEAEDAGRQVGEDAHGAAAGGGDAGAPAQEQPGGDGVDHPRAGDQDNQE